MFLISWHQLVVGIPYFEFLSYPIPEIMMFAHYNGLNIVAMYKSSSEKRFC